MTNTRTKQEERTLYIILAAALAARLLLALVTEGYTYDMSCFVAWGDKLASEGPAAFYSADYFADYPPGYILVLGLVSLVRKVLQLSYESRWTYFLLALIPAICDCAAVVLLDHISRRYMGQGRAQRCLVLFAAFCPLTLFDTGIWKQIDGAFALPLLLSASGCWKSAATCSLRCCMAWRWPSSRRHCWLGRCWPSAFWWLLRMPCGMAKAR